jgi:hypothetical protein
MALQIYRHLVTLDEPNGSAGYLPLDPATWYCAVFDEVGGIVRFEGPYHPGITTQTRVHFKGRIFHVDHVANFEARDVDIALTAHEVFE